MGNGDLLFPTSAFDCSELFFCHTMTSGEISLHSCQPRHFHTEELEGVGRMRRRGGEAVLGVTHLL